VQGGVLTSDVKDITLLDVTPLTLAIETLGDVATPMIAKNTTIPTEKSQVFSTAADNQPSVEIVISQGERPKARDNKVLGTFMLDGIPPAPRGVPQIEVTFKIDANGILNVKAKDKATGKEQGITITASTSLSEEEINKMMKQAEENATADKLFKDRAESRNDSLSLIFQTEKVLKDFGEKVDATKKTEIETKSKELKDLVEKEDFDVSVAKTKLDELNKLVQDVSVEMYKQTQNAEQPQASKENDAAQEENKSSTNSKDDAETQEGEVVK
jgi:molecular chaperone DnaK